MKILVVIESSNNAKTLANTTLRWAARAGFNFRILVPNTFQQSLYREAIADANHDYYLDLPGTVVITGVKVREFAVQHKFDLLVRLPDNLRKWNKWHSYDRNVIDYVSAIGQTRLRFSVDLTKRIERFPNGAVMERL